MVLYKGKIPCDVLFIGEAPGDSEDVSGIPFSGPAGQLLDAAINSALDVENWRKQSPFRLGFTNLVACVPKEEVPIEEGSNTTTIVKSGEPAKESIESCASRLEEMYKIARPKKVVCVGKLSEKYVPKTLDIAIEDTIGITHPAAVLRMDYSQKGLAYQRVIVQLEDLFYELEDQS